MFGDKKEREKELEINVNTWWSNLKYLKKIEILLENYPRLNITSIESQGVANLWRTAGDLERKKLIMKMWGKEQKKGRG